MFVYKRVVAGALAAVLIALAGCSSSSKDAGEAGALNPENPVTVTLWHYYVGENQQALERAVSDFNRTVGIERGVIVEAVAMGSIAELEESVTASAMGVINAKPMPQIFSSYPDKAMEIDAYEKIADLNAYFTDEEKSMFIGDFLADGIFEGGRFLMVPIVKSTELLYVNATDWEAFTAENEYDAQSLSTWESLYRTARAYYHWTDEKTPDIPSDGTALMGFDSVANYIIIACKQLGVDVIDADAGENGGAVLDRAVLRRLFNLYYEGISLGCFGAEGKFRTDDIKAGKMIAYVGSSSSAAYFPTWIEENNSQSSIDFLALPYPVFNDGAAYAIQQGAGMCVAQSTPGQQAGAALFLKWFTSSQQNIRFAMTTGYLPVQAGAYAAQEFHDALASLRSGEQAQRNVADVYEIALKQTTEFNTYAAKPFPGSYDVRSILQSTLISSALEGKRIADEWRALGAAEEDILERLDVEAQFDRWIAAVKQSLEEREIEYVER